MRVALQAQDHPEDQGRRGEGPPLDGIPPVPQGRHSRRSPVPRVAVGLSRVEGEPEAIKIGYTIAPAFQGRGYATEAVGALVAYALDTLGAGIVRAYASAENLASIRVAERVGMRLVERYTRGRGTGRWSGVRYELRRGEAGDAP